MSSMLLMRWIWKWNCFVNWCWNRWVLRWMKSSLFVAMWITTIVALVWWCGCIFFFWLKCGLMVWLCLINCCCNFIFSLMRRCCGIVSIWILWIWIRLYMAVVSSVLLVCVCVSNMSSLSVIGRINKFMSVSVFGCVRWFLNRIFVIWKFVVLAIICVKWRSSMVIKLLYRLSSVFLSIFGWLAIWCRWWILSATAMLMCWSMSMKVVILWRL